MTLQEMIQSLENLSQEDMISLLEILHAKLSKGETENKEQTTDNDDTFWDITLRFREQMELEGIEVTDEDFANLRDRSVGREVNL